MILFYFNQNGPAGRLKGAVEQQRKHPASRCQRLLVIALVSVGVKAGAANMCVPASMPPVESTSEASAIIDAHLVADCLSIVRQRFARLDYSFGQPVFTKEDRWGEIVRIDLAVSGTPANPDRYSRIVCFRQSGLPVKMGFFDMSKSACNEDRMGVTASPPSVK
jgi:hypothetical protein